MMPSNIRHSYNPSPMYCWFDGSPDLDAPAVSTATAPHDCMMPGCPGPVNLRKLEAFEELLAAACFALKLIDARDTPDSGASPLVVLARQQLRAAIAKARPQAQ